jgi:putative membrane protein
VRLLLRWLIAIIALSVAAWVVPDITVEDDAWGAFAVTAVILGLVNATVRPILRLLTLPITMMTIGLFLLVINGVTLWLAAWIAERFFDVGFEVAGLIPAILGAIIVSVVSTVLSFFLPDDDKG